METRYEILPFGTVEEEAAAAASPLVLTMTCSPRHGIDHTVEMAGRVAAQGHTVVVHLAARAVEDTGHLDRILERLATTGIDDVFVIGGDGQEPAGPFASAVDLLPLIAAHHRRPMRLGIGAYPEGHPLIEPRVLKAALHEKAQLADYMATQLCFDPKALISWVHQTRDAGIDLPLYVGIPGIVDRRRLLEVSMRVGVGTSIRFLKKQRGVGRLLGRPDHAANCLVQALAPLSSDLELGIVGFHFYTFNRLDATLAWERQLSMSQIRRTGVTRHE